MYPPEYLPKFDLRKAQDAGDKLSATEMSIELENVATALNQTILFMRSITTANMKIKPSQVSGTTFVIGDEQTATAAQTDIFFQNSVTISPTLGTVGVFINGVRLPDSDVTLFTDHVTVPALNLSDNIVLEIHDNADSVFNKLISNLNAMGASLVGIEDAAGLYAAATVEAALEEVGQNLADFIAAIGDLTKYLKADVAVPLEVDQDGAGFTWTGLRPAVADGEPVTLEQITGVLAILSDLAGTFLPLTGGIMQGLINMADHRIVNVGTPTADGDAVRKDYVDLAITTLEAKKLSLIGNKDNAANATITGPVFLNAADDADIADVDQTTDPATVVFPTWNDVPRPAANRQVANKIYVDEEVATGLSTAQLSKGHFIDRATATAVVGLITITKVGTGHHQIIVPAGVGSTFKIQGMSGGGGGGEGDVNDGANGGKTYFTLNAGAANDLATGGGGGDAAAGTAGTAGAVGAAATWGQPGFAGKSGASGPGGDGGMSAMNQGLVGIGGSATPTAGTAAQGYGAGGGGGGDNVGSGGGGGGGGAFGETFITGVVETDIIDLYAGAGGAGGSGSAASDGGAGAKGFIRIFWGE